METLEARYIIHIFAEFMKKHHQGEAFHFRKVRCAQNAHSCLWITETN